MTFLPLTVLWLGYTGAWYGYVLLQGQGVGIMDLVKPSQLDKVSAWLKTPKPSGGNAGTNSTGGSDSTTPTQTGGSSPTTPPAGWTPIPQGQVPAGGYVNPAFPNEVWVPGQGILQE